MQEEIKRILERIAKKHNLPLSTVLKIYRAPYEMIRKVWSKMDFEDPKTYEECNFYMIKMGVWSVGLKRVEALKNKPENGERRNIKQAKAEEPRGPAD